MEYYENYHNNKHWAHANDITQVTFENTINAPLNPVYTYDISKREDGSIMVYLVDDGLNQNTYHLYIQSNEQIYSPTNMSLWYGGDEVLNINEMKNLTQINNLNLINTSITTEMN